MRWHRDRAPSIRSSARAHWMPESSTYTSPGRLRRVEDEGERTGVVVPLQCRVPCPPAARARQLASRARVEEAKHADAFFVGDHCDRSAVGRQHQLFDVRARRAERFEPPGPEVEIGSTLEFAVAIGRQKESLAVAREVDLARCDRPVRSRARRRAAPAAAVRSRRPSPRRSSR